MPTEIRPWCACCRAVSPLAAGPGRGPTRRLFLRASAATAAAGGTTIAFAREGVEVGPPSIASKLVPAEQIERAAGGQYLQMLSQARAQRALAPESHPQMQRLRAIASRLIPHTPEWNPRARSWNWEVNLIGTRQINAFCMPGGKICFYYGILERLQLSDDEVAMIMGHEMTHALREHAREQLGKSMATRGAIELGAAIFGFGTGGRLIADMGGQLLNLRFGREDEKEADLIGLELAARAGYDPRAGVTLWQKMGRASQRQQIEFISTHPSGETRISGLQAAIPEVEGLYARAEKPPQRFGPPAPQASTTADQAPRR
jgi:predicted Zn-dependent protease